MPTARAEVDTNESGATVGALDGFTDALTDLTRRDRSVVVVLVAYCAVWTFYGVVAKGSQDLHSDMTELIAWSRDLALGFPKHPPFAATVVRGWFAILPISDWSFYLLAMLTAALALWIAWRQFADYLSPEKCLVALCLLTFIPFFNFHALKFNVNTVLMPLWAATTFLFLRSYRRQDATYAALAGAAAAFSMLTKYWSVFLIIGLILAALSDSRRSVYFRSAAPWITAIVGIAILSPHIGWLEKHHFSPAQYAMAVHGGHAMAGAAWADLRYLVDALAYVLVPIIIALLIARPNGHTVADMAWPADKERRLVACAFWATLLTPVVPALVWGIEIHAIWTMSSWTLLPIVLLSPPAVKIERQALRRLVGVAAIFPFAMLFASPGIALVIHEQGVPPEAAHIRILADRVEREWRETTTKPLRYVGGDFADGVLTYVHSRPRVMPDFPEYHSKRVMESGIALVCLAENPGCIATSSDIASRNPQSRKIETEIVRSYFGLAGQLERYVIFIVPPASL